jgi:PTS system ascorbate-specific IIA component
MLREFVEKNHYLFAKEAKDWEEAIRMSCKSLEADNTVDSGYAEQIIDCVNKYGPYIVLMPGVAMPHTQEGARGVQKTAIGFMKLEKPVSFDPADPEKEAVLFFTLAACDSDQHMKNMVRLSEMLLNEELVKELMKAETPEDLLRLQEKYLD